MTSLIIIMGVSASGKSLVGEHLASQLGWTFVDGDDLHPPENVELMRSGQKLDDETRKPWLAAICQCAESHFAKDQSVLIACSALKAKYREQLRTVSRPVFFLFLNGPQSLIAKRIEARTGHYMPASLLDSQFADLEDPTGEPGVISVDISPSKEIVLQDALEKTQRQLSQV